MNCNTLLRTASFLVAEAIRAAVSGSASICERLNVEEIDVTGWGLLESGNRDSVSMIISGFKSNIILVC